MFINSIFILSVILLPIQNFGFNLGFMTLKLSQILFLTYLALILINKHLRLNKIQKLEAFYFYLISFTLFASSLNAISDEKSTILTFAFILCAIFFVCACSYLNSTKDALLKLKSTMILSCSAYSLYGIMQLVLFFIGMPANVNYQAWDIVPRVPYFSSENTHAAFILLVLPFIIGDIISVKKNNINMIFHFITNVAGLVATGSRGAILSFAIILLFQVFFAITKSKVNYKTLISSIFAIIWLTYNFWDTLFLRFDSLIEGGDGTSEVRLNVYEIMYSHFVNTPFFGFGLDGAHTLGYSDIHNIFLMILFEGGIFSFTIFALLILTPLYLFFKKNTGIHSDNFSSIILFSFIGILVQAQFEPSLYFYHFYLALALLTSTVPTGSTQQSNSIGAEKILGH